MGWNRFADVYDGPLVPVPLRRDPTFHTLLSWLLDQLRDAPRTQVELILGRLPRVCEVGRARHLPPGVRGLPVFGLVCLLPSICGHLRYPYGPGLGEGCACCGDGYSEGPPEEGHSDRVHHYIGDSCYLCELSDLHPLHSNGQRLHQLRGSFAALGFLAHL